MDRIIGVLTLKSPVYREIAHNTSLTGSAGIIVAVVAVLVGLSAGFFQGLASGAGTGQAVMLAVAAAVIQIIAALIGWLAGSALTAFVAKSFFGGQTDTGEMMRIYGYTNIFNILGVIPVVGIIGGILAVIANVIGIREAAEFTTGKAVATAIIAGIIMILIVSVIVGIGVAAVASVLMIGGSLAH